VRNRNRRWTNTKFSERGGGGIPVTKTDQTFKVLEQDIHFTVLLDFLVWQIEESQVRTNRRITGKGKDIIYCFFPILSNGLQEISTFSDTDHH
jgi:hypothetical protein